MHKRLLQLKGCYLTSKDLIRKNGDYTDAIWRLYRRKMATIQTQNGDFTNKRCRRLYGRKMATLKTQDGDYTDAIGRLYRHKMDDYTGIRWRLYRHKMETLPTQDGVMKTNLEWRIRKDVWRCCCLVQS